MIYQYCMKQEEIFTALIRELFAMDELHQEYQDSDINFVVDSQREGNTLNIKVQLLENKDKEDFEQWLKNIDDDIFSEVLDELKDEGLVDLDTLYNSKDYKQVIDKVKNKTKEIALKRIKKLQSFIN